jgi:hypothetical protein
MGFDFDHGGEIDNHDDGQPELTRTETIFEVRGEFVNLETEDSTEVYARLLDILSTSKAEISELMET